MIISIAPLFKVIILSDPNAPNNKTSYDNCTNDPPNGAGGIDEF